jgi:hypothetical protein
VLGRLVGVPGSAVDGLGAGGERVGEAGWMDGADPWPLGSLVLRTPRLELRPDDDEGLRELVEVALGGVHPPAEMPFLQPWTDADPRYLGRGMLQYHWQQRACLKPQDWTVPFMFAGTAGWSAASS